VTLLIPVLAFVFVSLLVMAAAMAFSSGGAMTIEQRLGEVTGTTPKLGESSYEKAVVDGLKRLGNLVPKSPSEMGKLRMKLVTAGYRGTEALIIFFGIRVALAVAPIQETVVVTATRTEAPAAQVGASVTVFTSEDLDRRR